MSAFTIILTFIGGYAMFMVTAFLLAKCFFPMGPAETDLDKMSKRHAARSMRKRVVPLKV